MRKRPDLTIGVLSDTHLPYRLASLPPIIYNIFRDVDYILHAGDVDDITHLNLLEKIAPLYAVRGNVHLQDLSFGGKNLPLEVRLTLANHHIVVTHGHRPGLMGWLFKAPELIAAAKSGAGGRVVNEQIVNRLYARYAEADVVIFGHTHAPYAKRIGGTLFFNPGSVAPSQHQMTSVGLLHLWPQKVEVQIIPLDHLCHRINRLKRWVSSAQ
jgi:hypothetical protein